MIVVRKTKQGARVLDVTDMQAGATAILLGGAKSLATQNLDVLRVPGVLVMAMNNAAVHLHPTMWIGVDRPECYDPKILLDPTILKFGNLAHADVMLGAEYGGRMFHEMPNTVFYSVEANVPLNEVLNQRHNVPWYENTLFTAIFTLYSMGVRTIILAGSDFTIAGTDAYAHDTTLTPEQLKWNSDLYEGQVLRLRMLKPIFDNAGLKLLDCSAASRLGEVYPHISIEEAASLCLAGLPSSYSTITLPHCSVFAPQKIRDTVTQWKGYQ